MARVHQVAKRRIGRRGAYALRCQSCGGEIEIGEPYKWFKMKQARGGIKKCYHPDCPIPPSHRTTSRLGEIWDAQAALDFYSAEDVDALQALLSDLADAVQSVADQYRGSVTSMEEGFGHRTGQADELEARAEALEGWADELRDWEPDADEPGADADEDEREQWLEEIRSEASSAAEECPV